jgi:hypothetical protein
MKKFWMYNVIIGALERELADKISTKYKPALTDSEIEDFMSNEFHELGKLNLTILEMSRQRDEHSVSASAALNGTDALAALAVDSTSVGTGKFVVYKGELNGKIVYIGTTIQKPADRFRWHRNNGKNLNFTVLARFHDEKQMLDLEFELIKKYNPSLNNIKHRKQNLNVRLDQATLDARKGKTGWCQSCLKRKVNRGYSKCYWCS